MNWCDSYNFMAQSSTRVHHWVISLIRINSCVHLAVERPKHGTVLMFIGPNDAIMNGIVTTIDTYGF